MRALVWFRSDLRVADNRALWHACREATRGVIGVFLVSGEQWRRHDWGSPKVEFVMRCAASLADDLARLGVPLRIEQAPLFADAPGRLVATAAAMGCDAVFVNREYEVNERRRDDLVEAACRKAGVAFRSYTDQVLFEPGEIRTGQGRWYTVFTPFKAACLSALSERGVELSGDPRPQGPPGRPTAASPVVVAGFADSGVPVGLWPGGAAEAHSRLRRFAAERLGAYEDDRNIPAEPGSSRLSPYLSAGAVSPRQCLRAALESGGGRIDRLRPGAATWVGELLWREFYRHIVVGFPRVSMGRAFKPETERIRWREDPEALAAWKEGRTGFPIVDAGMRQLLSDGWMHNRARMITAMFLTKDLLIDWREGERHFMRHLVDGDLASNNGGWQWSASTGTDATPYFRVFNPTSQSRSCDPGGGYIRRYVPELAALGAEDIHDPPPLMRLRADYPGAIVDHAASRARAIAAFRGLRPPAR